MTTWDRTQVSKVGSRRLNASAVSRPKVPLNHQCQSTRRHIPEDCFLHSHRSENLKSYTVSISFSLLEEFFSRNKNIGLAFGRLRMVSQREQRLSSLMVLVVLLKPSSRRGTNLKLCHERFLQHSFRFST
jgi:hypothetical protein